MVRLLAGVFFIVIALSSCKDETSYGPQMDQMKDSIFNAWPNTVASVRIHVEDKTDIRIVLGGEALYKTPADKRQQMANELGAMAVRIFGKDSYLKKGNLVLTKNERNSSDSPPDGIVSPINIDSLKKAGRN